LPFRGGGTLNSSQTVDAQAGYQTLMTMLPTFLAGTNWVMHSAGWLEGGLVSSYDKFIVDIEILQALMAEFTPLEFNEASLAFDAHQEVGHGGHFLGAAHTMERFRDCFYRPFLTNSDNYDRWTRLGAKDTRARAEEIWKKKLEEYVQPEMDASILTGLQDYVAKRKSELGE
jgi:trimethylamine--corrinoid protein Co-methyltransferase